MEREEEKKVARCIFRQKTEPVFKERVNPSVPVIVPRGQVVLTFLGLKIKMSSGS